MLQERKALLISKLHDKDEGIRVEVLSLMYQNRDTLEFDGNEKQKILQYGFEHDGSTNQATTKLLLFWLFSSTQKPSEQLQKLKVFALIPFSELRDALSGDIEELWNQQEQKQELSPEMYEGE